MSARVVAPGPWLILSAGMGAGHDQVAHQLAARIRDRGGRVLVLDLLEVLPAGVGRGIRRGYSGMLRAAPWLYEAIFRVFFDEHRFCRPGTYPLDALAAHRLRSIIEGHRPCAVVSTFHLAAQTAGRMRRRGGLDAPSVVVITEPAAHRQWLHPETDMFLCPYPWVAAQARERTGRPACAPGPVVGERFHGPADAARGRRLMGLRAGEDAVLVSAGSWGVGEAATTARWVARLEGARPVVLCGRNERLRRRIAGVAGCVALGWRDDLPDLFAGSAVLVDQSGGGTCAEAFAAGLPVVVHRPLPGHGRLGVRALAEAGVVSMAPDGPALLEAVDRLRRPCGVREAQLARASAVFVHDPVEVLVRWVAARRTRF
ncbi:MGDG synthase family glycosyltransferase [Pseudonocardia acidicola]|uniref:Glycosyltransferase n=1 Tax=Pseudonocardia acidicola TaxID=2724939 RepID=A0ABX1SDH0_9PSEU|nr:glycosyltransferase [Pseudonocardia acidicola]NMH98401.1 glycosyltransferase [Pseudonocardia acidicola]